MNLEILTIISVPRAVTNFEAALQEITHSHLTELKLVNLNQVYSKLTLPPTLKKLVVKSGGQVFIATPGEAKLRYLHVENLILLPEHVSSWNSNVNTLVMSSVETLECLNLRYPGFVPLDLSKHVFLSTVSLDAKRLSLEDGFVAPPATRTLHLTGRSHEAAYIENILQMFGSSLVDVKLHMRLSSPKMLDISQFGNIETLKLVDDGLTVTCAPNNHLRIVCPHQLPHVINKGQGGVSIETKSLLLRNGLLPSGSVLNHLDWSLIHSIHLNYSEYSFPNIGHVDYGPLSQAINVRSVRIQNDSSKYFAVRNGAYFLQMFPKLGILEWEMDNQVCFNLTPSGFVLPNTVTHLQLMMHGLNVATDDELIHLLDWMRHVPSKLSFTHIPLTPKMIAMCNDATSPLQFDYKSHKSITNSAIWTDAPVFAPSPHLSRAIFHLFDEPSNKKTRIVQKIFDSHRLDPDVDRYTVILHVAEDE